MPSLEALLASDIEIAAVVTNPDRPAGRGMEPRPSPVKVAAADEGVEVIQVERARDPALAERLRALAPDVAPVVAYGSLLPAELLEVPRLGFVNLHFSLLPEYRGAAPVQRALIDGATRTGVSVMVLTEGMDEGPVLATLEVDVGPDETAGSLGERLARLGAPLLVSAIERYAAGELHPMPQDDTRATYAPKITAEEARIDWSRLAAAIRNQIRALNPEPGAWTTLREKRLRVHRAEPSPEPAAPPGELIAGRELVVGTGDVPLRLVEVQAAGKRSMSGAELARGLRPTPGERVE